MEWKELQGHIYTVIEGAVVVFVVWGGRVAGSKIKPTYKALKELMDLDEWKKGIETRVIKSENDYKRIDGFQKAFVNINKFPMFITNGKGELIFVNNEWMNQIGCRNMNEVLVKGYLQAIPPEDIEGMEEWTERLLDHPSESTSVSKVRFKHMQTGEIINMVCITYPILNNDGSLYATVGRLDEI